jgi:hypothetical protein
LGLAVAAWLASRKWDSGFVTAASSAGSKPKMAPTRKTKDRQALNLNRAYSLNQVEYCRNFIFKRHLPIHKIFEHSCQMGRFRLAADKVAYIFGVRVSKRLRGKLHSVLEKLDHGHHVLRVYCKNLEGRLYEKFSTFLRVEACVC